MAFFGFKSSKEVEEEKKKALEAAMKEADAKLKDEKAKALAKGMNIAIQHNYANLDNLSHGSQVEFTIPYFDIFDPRFSEMGIPVSVDGSLTYAIEDMDLFHSLNKMEDFSNDGAFKAKLKSTITKYVKGVITNAPTEANIPVVQIETKIMQISDLVQNHVTPQIERTFGIKVRSLDITEINIKKDSMAFQQLKALTSDFQNDMLKAQQKAQMANFDLQNKMNTENTLAQHNANLSNFNLNNQLQQQQMTLQSSLNMDAMSRKQEMQLDAMERQQELQIGGQEQMQAMQFEHQREMMRIQREEMQRASRLQTEQTFLGAHQANMNAGMMNKAIDNGMDVFGGMSQMQGMGGMPQMPGMGGMPQMPGMPGMAKPVPQVQYLIGVNGQQAGPFDWNQLQQLVQQGQLTVQTLVWTQGMANWDYAGNVAELAPLFQNSAPQMPGMPGMGGMPGMY
jgi:hypothetical protein